MIFETRPPSEFVYVSDVFRTLEDDKHPYSFLKHRNNIILYTTGISSIKYKNSFEDVFVHKHVVRDIPERGEIELKIDHYVLSYNDQEYIQSLGDDIDNTLGLKRLRKVILKSISKGKNVNEINDIIQAIIMSRKV